MYLLGMRLGMRRHLFHPRMVERTCLRCAETWTLRARLARARPPRRRGGGFGLTDGGAVIGARGNVRITAVPGMDAGRGRGGGAVSQREVFYQMQTCPKCGSDGRYTQRRVS